jgi:RNA polymerase sigma factor (sigma-70 family)
MPLDSVRFDTLAMPEEDHEFLPTASGLFRTTHWSAIVRAGHGDSVEWAAALNELCQVYWRPLYAYARHQAYAAHEAEDLTQAFFARLIEKDLVAQAAPEKGRFRSFLLTVFKRFLANEWHHQHTQKRGGFQPVVPIDTEIAESCLGPAPSHLEPPDVLFERQWAMTLLEQVMRQLQREYAESGRSSLYDRLEACLVRDEAALRYADIGAQFNLTEAAVKMAMQRLRARYQTILREEIGKTVASPEEVEDEIRDLFAAFKR